MNNEMTIEEFLAENERKDLLRFSTAGSIDDGKSTLIGRLLHDSKNVYEDQIEAVRNVSKDQSSEELIDFALLTDGLKAEREQGITIDVAYRYFSTPKRKFIIADTPGHEQYTRNMATGASTANLAIVLVDARSGVLAQTKRHAFIAALLGVPHIVVAINKMDLVDYSQEAFESIQRDFVDFAGKLTVPDIRFIPVSALLGDNVVDRSDQMPWYKGESLLEILETVYIASDHNLIDLRFPVQYVQRPDHTFRGYCGQVASGVVRQGDELMALPSMKTSKVASIVTFDGDVEEAFPPMSVTITLEDERDISRGDVLVHPHNVPRMERRFESMLVWMGEADLDLNRAYEAKLSTQTRRVRIDEVRYKIDVNTLNRTDAGPLALNEIGRVVFTSTTPLIFDAYQKNRTMGCFILIDPMNNSTVAAGMIIEREPADQLPSSEKSELDFTKRESAVTAEERIERNGQDSATIWMTGLVGSGKTQIAYALERRLFELGASAIVLDGENMRLGVSRELDFSASGRAEHLRRVAETARLINDSGILTICAFVSPLAEVRQRVANIVREERFVEVHVATPVEWCEQHDDTGLYAKARAGDVGNLAGVNAEYQAPVDPAISLTADSMSIDECAGKILDILRIRNIFPASNK